MSQVTTNINFSKDFSYTTTAMWSSTNDIHVTDTDHTTRFGGRFK